MPRFPVKETRRLRKAALAKFERDFQRLNGLPQLAIGVSDTKEGLLPTLSMFSLKKPSEVVQILRLMADRLEDGTARIKEGS